MTGATLLHNDLSPIATTIPIFTTVLTDAAIRIPSAAVSTLKVWVLCRPRAREIASTSVMPDSADSIRTPALPNRSDSACDNSIITANTTPKTTPIAMPKGWFVYLIVPPSLPHFDAISTKQEVKSNHHNHDDVPQQCH